MKADPDKIRDLAAEGHSQATIALFLGVSRERIRQICNRDGIETLSGHINHDLRDRILEALNESPDCDTRLAKRLGVSAVTVRANRIKMGLPKVDRSRRKPQIQECADAGMTLAETGRKLGLSTQNVWTLARRWGIAFHVKHRRGRA